MENQSHDESQINLSIEQNFIPRTIQTSEKPKFNHWKALFFISIILLGIIGGFISTRSTNTNKARLETSSVQSPPTITGSTLKFEDITSFSNQLTFIPPPEGLDTEEKKRLHDHLAKIDYLQPSYIPTNFVKLSDGAGDSGIGTFYDDVNTNLKYSGLSLTQEPIAHAQYKSVEGVMTYIETNKPSDQRYLAKSLSINNYPAVYVQTPPRLVDPYMLMSFMGSEEERLMATNTEKTLYLFTPKALITFTIGYTTSISDSDAESELTKMAKSLKKGSVPESLNLNAEDIAELTTISMERTADNLLATLLHYFSDKKGFPWQTTPNCLGGTPPQEVHISSREFGGCLTLLEPYRYQTRDEDDYNRSVFSYLYITYGDVEDFYQPRSDSDSLEIYKSDFPKICYKPLELSDYAKSALIKDTNPTYLYDQYPMYTRGGKVNESCKSNYKEQECYSCTSNLGRHLSIK